MCVVFIWCWGFISEPTMASCVTTQRWHTNTHMHTRAQESNTVVLNEHLYILRKINHTQIRQITCSFQISQITICHIHGHTVLLNFSDLRGRACGRRCDNSASAGNHWQQYLQGYLDQNAHHLCSHNIRAQKDVMFYLIMLYNDRRDHRIWRDWKEMSVTTLVSIPFIICHDDCWIGQCLSYSCQGKNKSHTPGKVLK